MREGAGTVITALGANANVSQRQHVGIRPTAAADIRFPGVRDLKLPLQRVPLVPKIPGDAPHLCVHLQKICVELREWAWRKAQHNYPACLLESFMQCEDFGDARGRAEI